MSVPMLSGYAVVSLARAMCHPLSLQGKALGSTLREQVILRVSSINGCSVCSAIHGAVARIGGLSADDVQNARTPANDDDLDDRTRLLLHYAEIRTANLEADFPQVVEAFESDFDSDEKREVRALVDLFTFNNRFNNSWESWVPGANKRRDALGLVPRS